MKKLVIKKMKKLDAVNFKKVDDSSKVQKFTKKPIFNANANKGNNNNKKKKKAIKKITYFYTVKSPTFETGTSTIGDKFLKIINSKWCYGSVHKVEGELEKNAKKFFFLYKRTDGKGRLLSKEILADKFNKPQPQESELKILKIELEDGIIIIKGEKQDIDAIDNKIIQSNIF